ncbi:hypothetical protein KFE25_004279 [Diacronema lutheri]|uniref:Uncharacterized protein n=1 Tax=Diacronema lutheri TaxID=2081491 RepID=A0A8J6C6D9_DIALT|nr:hypothetical protein KFE25_004279 [Diacronema lutheri]
MAAVTCTAADGARSCSDARLTPAVDDIAGARLHARAAPSMCACEARIATGAHAEELENLRQQHARALRAEADGREALRELIEQQRRDALIVERKLRLALRSAEADLEATREQLIAHERAHAARAHTSTQTDASATPRARSVGVQAWPRLHADAATQAATSRAAERVSAATQANLGKVPSIAAWLVGGTCARDSEDEQRAAPGARAGRHEEIAAATKCATAERAATGEASALAPSAPAAPREHTMRTGCERARAASVTGSVRARRARLSAERACSRALRRAEPPEAKERCPPEEGSARLAEPPEANERCPPEEGGARLAEPPEAKERCPPEEGVARLAEPPEAKERRPPEEGGARLAERVRRAWTQREEWRGELRRTSKRCAQLEAARPSPESTLVAAERLRQLRQRSERSQSDMRERAIEDGVPKAPTACAADAPARDGGCERAAFSRAPAHASFERLADDTCMPAEAAAPGRVQGMCSVDHAATQEAENVPPRCMADAAQPLAFAKSLARRTGVRNALQGRVPSLNNRLNA